MSEVDFDEEIIEIKQEFILLRKAFDALQKKSRSIIKKVMRNSEQEKIDDIKKTLGI